MPLQGEHTMPVQGIQYALQDIHTVTMSIQG